MRLRPTELGIKGGLLLAALAVAFFAAAYSNLFFLIIAFCAVLGSLGLWWTARNPRAVTVEVLDAPVAAADSDRPLRLAVSAGARGVFDLSLTVDIDGEQHELVHIAHLRGNRRLTATLPAGERGVRRVTAIGCRSRFPFGLFEAARRLPVDLELVTYPRPLAPPAGVRETAAEAGQLARPGAAIAGLRPFRAGDSQRDVHWKASARRGEPIVKEREAGAADALEIVVDRRFEGDGAEFEATLSRATMELLHAIESERTVHLRSQDFATTVEPGRPPGEALRWLATTSPVPANAGPPARPRESVHA